MVHTRRNQERGICPSKFHDLRKIALYDGGAFFFYHLPNIGLEIKENLAKYGLFVVFLAFYHTSIYKSPFGNFKILVRAPQNSCLHQF